MKKIIPILLVVISLVTATVLLLPASPQYREKKLESGFVIRIKSVRDLQFPDGSSTRVLTYYTDTDPADIDALRVEAERIWDEFRLNVEEAGFKSASLNATESPKKLISITSGYMFHFKQQDDGRWVLHGN